MKSPTRRDFLKKGALTGGVAGAATLIGTQVASAGEKDDTVERISKSGEMRITYAVWPPTVIKDPKKSELEGHFVAMAKHICEEMKVKPVWVESDWATWIAALQAGQADISIGATYATTLRAQSVDFTDPIIYLGWQAALRPGLEGDYKRLADLDREDITIVGVDGGATLQYVQRVFKKAKIDVLASGTDDMRAYLAVMSGRADMYVGDDYVQRKVMAEHPGKLVSMFAEPFRMNSVCWAVRRGDYALLNLMKVALRNIRDRGLDVEFERAVDADWIHPVPNFVSTNDLG